MSPDRREKVFSNISHFFTVISGEKMPSIKSTKEIERSKLMTIALLKNSIVLLPLSKQTASFA
jgi:hypothetical protein